MKQNKKGGLLIEIVHRKGHDGKFFFIYAMNGHLTTRNVCKEIINSLNPKSVKKTENGLGICVEFIF